MSMVGKVGQYEPCVLHMESATTRQREQSLCGQTGPASFSKDARHLSIAQPFLLLLLLHSRSPPLSTYRKYLHSFTQTSFHPPQNAEGCIPLWYFPLVRSLCLSHH